MAATIETNYKQIIKTGENCLTTRSFVGSSSSKSCPGKCWWYWKSYVNITLMIKTTMSPTDRNKNNIKDSTLQEQQQQHHLQIVLVRTKTAAAALMPMKTTTTNITTNIAEQNRSTLSSSSSASASTSTSTSTVQTRTGQTNNRIAWKTKLLLLFVKDSSYL